MIINILIIVLCIAADQLTKICAAANLKDISTLPIIENIFHLPMSRTEERRSVCLPITDGCS